MVNLNRSVVRRVFVSVDWGFTNPGVMQVWATDGDIRMYLVYEIYQTGRTIDWWKAQAKAINEHFAPECFVCDPSEPAYISQLREVGVNAVAADNEVRLGIEKVQERLKVQKDGRPRLMVFDGAITSLDTGLKEKFKPVCTSEEFPSYTYPQSKDGKPVKEEPMKVDDHGVDGVRYAVMYLDGPRNYAPPGSVKYA